MPMNLRKLYYALPASWRFVARRLWYAPADLWDRLAGKRDPLTPPRGLIYTGRGDFRRSGRALVRRCVEWGGLQPHHAVLDVGSGIGRAAVALTEYLDARGRYEGFDPVATGVRWCQRHISSRHPNFRFRHVPLANDLYTQAGEDARRFRFPYPAAAFDFAIVNSVFTHMLPDEIAHYLEELARVLRPGGRAYATFFLFEKNGPCGMPGFAFPHDYGHYRLMDRRVRAANVAVAHAWLQEVLERHHFDLIHHFAGTWNGGAGPDFQDVLILE
ncbi:MAG: class I SAM-dependent methyltransferase, partial [Alphaproteobacteria bacterium]